MKCSDSALQDFAARRGAGRQRGFSPLELRGGATLLPRRPAGRQRGFSLLELLLALALGLGVVAGMVQLFAGTRQTHALLEGQSRMQEGGRYALAFIGRSARAAGYLGCAAGLRNLRNALNGGWDQLFELDVRQPVQAFDYVGDGAGTALDDWAPSLASLPRRRGTGATLNAFARNTGIDLDALAPGADLLAFRQVEAPGYRLMAPAPPNGNPVVEDRDGMDLEEDDFAVISDCEQAALFRVTGVVPAAGRVTLLRDAGTGVYDNSPAQTLSPLGRPYGASGLPGGALVGRVRTEIYFIADGTGPGAEPRSLWRRSGVSAPVELVEGVQDLQILLGLDADPNDGFSAPGRYLPASRLSPDDAVRAIRVQVRAGAPAGPGRPLTRSFAQTIALRNLADGERRRHSEAH